MVIVLVMDQFDVEGNGTTVSAKRFAEALARRGNEVRIVTTGKEGPNRYIVKEKHDLVSYFAKKQKMVVGKPDKKVFREAFEGADVVHFMLPLFLSVTGKKVADEMGIPTTTAFHLQPENVTFNIGMGRVDFLNHFVYHFFNRVFYRNFNHIHCPTKFITNELINHGYQANIYTISNGVDPIFKQGKSDQKEKKLQDKFVILMIGRYSPEKRQDVLIDAIEKSKYRDKIQLILAGAGPTEEKLRKMSEEKLANKAIFGFYSKEDLLKVIQMSDLYVHASEIEIEAISCIEAFTCGLVPIISNSEKSATKQFAIDDRSLFQVNDSTDLSRKIDYWIEHEEERKHMGNEYIKLSEKYRLDHSIDQIMEMFENAIYEKQQQV